MSTQWKQEMRTRPNMISNLANELGKLSDQTDSIDDLNNAVNFAAMAVCSMPSNFVRRTDCLHVLAFWLGKRFERVGSIQDLTGAIDIVTAVLNAMPLDHPDRPLRLYSRGYWLSERFEKTKVVDDLTRSINDATMTVDATPHTDPLRAGRLDILASRFERRFDETGLIEDIDSATKAAEMAVEAADEDITNRAKHLNNLGNCLGRRYDQTASMVDLDRAIDLITLSVEVGHRHHSDRVLHLSNLGTCLQRRSLRVGSMDDLNRAIEVMNMAGDVSHENPHRITYLIARGIGLGMLYGRTKSLKDLNSAIESLTIAEDACSRDHPKRPIILSNLGQFFNDRFLETELTEDIDRAIEYTTGAIDACPENNPTRASYLNNLGMHFGRRYTQSGSREDLSRAIDRTSEAIDASPRQHPNRAVRLYNIGDWLIRRFDLIRSPDDRDRALSCYLEGLRCEAASPRIRTWLASDAAEVYGSQAKWKESSQLSEEAVTLLSTVSPRSLKHTDKEHALGGFFGVASLAASTILNANGDVIRALQLLELGRGIIASLLMDIRGDMSDVREKHPALADKFITLRDELDKPEETLPSLMSPGNTIASLESSAKRRREADQRLNQLITEIRNQPGFNNFLLPPTAESLKAAANPDPIIVINLSRFRCDAFLIEHHQIRVLNLPDMTLTEAETRARHLQSSRLRAFFDISPLLEWLWDVVARPCLDELGFKGPPPDGHLPRVWWIPTGPLSQLPLHAAGYHTKGSSETVLDRVMSSYASSVKSLIFGRRQDVKPPSSDSHALLVAMRETPDLAGDGILSFAADELKMVKDFCPSLNLQPIMPKLRRDDVLELLKSCTIFHFAGHGKANSKEPSLSCLLLEDWKAKPLTVGDIRDHRLQGSPPFLGFLSACSTGANDTGKLIDEGIHLINSFQLAGFRHVIGTLWEVSDEFCVDVARVLYRTLRDEGMTDVAVCRGLHFAVRELRDEEMKKGEEARKRAEARDVTLVGSKTEMQSAMNPYWV
ncbi:hypothetical protein CP533_5334, partial [Ophiocordyceps camponoti-saundersi (nom. inval.)]